MKISTKGRYALRFMIDLAANSSDGYISLAEIANRQGISKKYLEQIIPSLLHADFLDTERGTHGGYKLKRDAAEYSVGEILRLSEGTLAPVECLRDEINNCDKSCDCVTLPIWIGLERTINDYLNGITLKDVITKGCKLNAEDS